MTVDPLITQLVEARIKAGLTQRALAKAAGTCQSHISDLETGQGTQGPCLDTLRRWARALGLEPVLVPLTYRPGFEDPQTAPVERFNSAVHGAPRQVKGPVDDGAPASAPVEVGSDLDRADVAQTAVAEPIFSGGLMRCDLETLRERTVAATEGEIQQCKYSDDRSHRAIFSNGGWHWLTPGWAEQLTQDATVARTLDVAERTVEKARFWYDTESRAVAGANVDRFRHVGSLPSCASSTTASSSRTATRSTSSPSASSPRTGRSTTPSTSTPRGSGSISTSG